ncbi:MAG TPA: DUF4097 family beta strand repeat-containing protein [Terriglobales bacterium]|nr:DUF4097 family beta strand repeat-containing protein [Terriglobales bacterium]
MANGYAHPHRGSVLGPLVLIALGVIFLLRHHIPGFDAWQFIARYWPALLIVWGLVRLAEHYSDPSGARRGLSGGEVVLLILVVLIGLGVTASWRWRNSDWGRNAGMEFWDPFARDFTFNAAAQAALPPHMGVFVISPRGDVELVAGAPGVAAASVTDDVRAQSDSEAQRRFRDAQPTLRVENGQMVVRPAGNSDSGRVAADLRLSLPPDTPVVVRTDHGDIRVAHWRANLDLASSRGDLAVSGLAGALRGHVEHGDATIQDVSGSLELDGNGGDITLAHVRGAVTINGNFSGDLDLSNLPAGVQYSSSRTQLQVAALPGSLKMDMGDLHAVAARGLQVTTRDKDIAVDDFTGELRVDDTHGTITAASAGRLRDAVSITDRDGDITLSLPADSAFTLDAFADQGSLAGDFGVPAGAGTAHLQVGGGGPPVHLRTTDGTITLRKLAPKTAGGAL